MALKKCLANSKTPREVPSTSGATAFLTYTKDKLEAPAKKPSSMFNKIIRYLCNAEDAHESIVILEKEVEERLWSERRKVGLNNQRLVLKTSMERLTYQLHGIVEDQKDEDDQQHLDIQIPKCIFTRFDRLNENLDNVMIYDVPNIQLQRYSSKDEQTYKNEKIDKLNNEMKQL